MLDRSNCTINDCRGRLSLHDTSRVKTSFTDGDLDAIAPLQRGDSSGMGDHDSPTPELIERMNRRIEAARSLKHGV